MDTENKAQTLMYAGTTAKGPTDAASTAQDSMKAERGSTVPSDPDSFYPSSNNPQHPTALCPYSSNDVNHLANHHNPPQPHRPSHPNTMGPSTTTLTVSNLKEHSRQISLLRADPGYATRDFGQERRDMMTAALQSFGHGDLPDWVIEEMAKRV